MSETSKSHMNCEKCNRSLPGVEEVAGVGLYWVDPDHIKRDPAQNPPGFFGGKCACPHCGVVYTLHLMPFAGDPSSATALYRLHIMTDLTDNEGKQASE